MNPTESPSKSPTESPSINPTESPSKSPTESPTEDPTEAPIEDVVEDDFNDEIDETRIKRCDEVEFDEARIDDFTGEFDEARIRKCDDEGIRTVQLSHPEALSECMTYSSTLDMADCSTPERRGTDVNDDHWEILEATEEDLFRLRHKLTQQCIPINPENPDRPFNCNRYFGMDQAIADSINGLVDCDSGFAAAFGMVAGSISLYLNNTGCQDDTIIDPDVIFMTYSQGEASDGKRIVVWGEKILLDLEEVVEKYKFQTEWTFVDV